MAENGQSTLDAFDSNDNNNTLKNNDLESSTKDKDDSHTTNEDGEYGHPIRNVTSFSDPMISDDADLSDDSCPWCLHPADDFTVETSDGLDDTCSGEKKVSCPNCGSMIPVDAEWYQNGDKII